MAMAQISVDAELGATINLSKHQLLHPDRDRHVVQTSRANVQAALTRTSEAQAG